MNLGVSVMLCYIRYIKIKIAQQSSENSLEIHLHVWLGLFIMLYIVDKLKKNWVYAFVTKCPACQTSWHLQLTPSLLNLSFYLHLFVTRDFRLKNNLHFFPIRASSLHLNLPHNSLWFEDILLVIYALLTSFLPSPTDFTITDIFNVQ